MKDRITIKKMEWGSGKWEGTYEGSDGKHFCSFCGRMLRIGQRIIESCEPAPFKRETRYSYHHKECP